MFETFGEFLMAVRAQGLKSPLAPVDPRLQRRGAAGGSEAVPGDGGFLIQPEFVRPLVERMYLTGALLSRCTEFPISSSDGIILPQFDESSRQNGSRMGGFQAYWAAEAAPGTGSKPKFLRSELITKKLIGLVYCTDELYRDSAALEIFVSMGLSKEMAFCIEDSIVNADGLTRPLGIRNSPAMIQVPKQGSQANGTVVAQNIIDMWARCWAPSCRTAVWLMHKDAEAQLIGSTVTVGAGGSAIPLYVATTDPDNQPYNLVLGRPVITIEQAPAPGTPGDVMLADMSRYALAMRETRSDVSMHVNFSTDEEAFKFVCRIDGQPIDARPITPFNGTNTVSPFVSIAQR